MVQLKYNGRRTIDVPAVGLRNVNPGDTVDVPAEHVAGLERQGWTKPAKKAPAKKAAKKATAKKSGGR